MSKRIALICKGFESLEKSDLKYLDNSVNKVSTVLDDYWKVEEPYVVSDTGALKNKIESFRQDFDELLFYYIGHGVVENAKFYIVGSDNDRINLKDILLLTEQWNKKVTIVLDACHSGQFINEWDNKIKYEIFTSSNTKVAYEDPNYEMAFFTYHFCRAIAKNKQHAELSVENIYDEINDIVVTRQKCTHHRVKSYGNRSNVMSRCNQIYSITHDLSEPIKKVKPPKVNQIFLIFNEDNNSTTKYQVVGYVQCEDDLENDLIEFTFENIYDEKEQENFIAQLISEAELDNVPIHMILPPTLFLANLKQWKYRGTEFKNFYHIVLHNKEKFDKKVGRYQNMIDNWNALFESLKSLDITDSLLITSNDSDRFDSGDFKIGVCFRHCVSNYEVIRDTLAMAYIGLWQYSDGTLTDYHKWIDRGICLEKLHKDSRSCGHMALLWDDMSLLEELKRQELKREKL